MEIIIFIGLIIQLALLLYFFTKLSQIARNTNQTAKSAGGNFLLNLFTKFHQDSTLKKIHQTLKLSPDDQNVLNLVADESQDLFYYLNFLEFVASLEGDELESGEIYALFGRQFDNLRKHQTLQDKFIVAKRPHTEKLLKTLFRPKNETNNAEFHLPPFG